MTMAQRPAKRKKGGGPNSYGAAQKELGFWRVSIQKWFQCVVTLTCSKGRQCSTSFDSRVDIYLPEGKSLLASLGQRMIASETVLADLRSDELVGELAWQWPVPPPYSACSS